MKKSSSFRSLLPCTLAAAFATCAAWSHSAVAQTVVFSTNFDSYTAAASLSGQELWTSNDLYTGASYNPGSGAREIGQSEDISNNSGYATSTSDLQPFLGGAVNVNGGSVPGRSTVYVYRPFSLGAAATMQFNVDFAVSQPGTGAHDSFGFNFQNGGTTNLFSVNFVASTAAPTTVDNVTITSGGVTQPGLGSASFTLGSRYHLTVNVNITGGTFSASLQAETATGTLSGPVIPLINNLGFAGTINDVAATWTLANTANTAATTVGTNPAGGASTNNTAYTAGGINTLLFDNYVISIPEPSTYALLGLGVAALGMGLRRRRLA